MKYYLLILIILFLSGCIEVETPTVVKNGDILPQNICKNLDKVIVVEKTGCPACATAVPRLEQVEAELGVEFLYYNTAVSKERTELLNLGFVPTHVPAVVINCKVYTGILSKNKYKELIEEWLVA